MFSGRIPSGRCETFGRIVEAGVGKAGLEGEVRAEKSASSSLDSGQSKLRTVGELATGNTGEAVGIPDCRTGGI